MIKREIARHLANRFRQYPVVTVTGPRQSGKTMLCRQVFPGLEYVNLEAPDRREFAESDPRGFLAQLGTGAIIDEVHRVPSLLSYLQVLVDEDGRNGLFVLTGSEQFRLGEAVNSSLSGRTAGLRLLPFSLSELRKTGASDEVDDVLFSGFYPRIHDRGLDPSQALGDYFETYVERDVRRLANVRDTGSFRRFVRLCAGRVGQLLNLSSLGSDAGVTRPTVRDWLSVLEESYIAFRLHPYHAKIGRRLVKSSKLYFYDVGLASYLMGIEHAGQMATHPLRGFLFENAVVVETLKHRFNRGRRSNLSFYRDSSGLECDLLYASGGGYGALEIKSGATVSSDYFSGLDRVSKVIPEIWSKVVVYGGARGQSRSDAEVVTLKGLPGFLDRFESDGDVGEAVQEDRGAVEEGGVPVCPSPLDTRLRGYDGRERGGDGAADEGDGGAGGHDGMGRGGDGGLGRGAVAVDGDMAIIDDVFRSFIRPTIEELEPNLAPLGEVLFESSARIDFVGSGSDAVSSSDLFDVMDWERTKREHIAKRGFVLRYGATLDLRQDYILGDYKGVYKGIGDANFDVKLSILWRLGESELLWEVAIDDSTRRDFTRRILYSEVPAMRDEVAGVVETILDLWIAEIEARIDG